MNPAEPILAKVGEGPVTIQLEDESEYEIELDTVDVEGDGFHAEGTDPSGTEYRYRIDKPPHSDEPLVLERQPLPEGKWEELGRAAFASQGI